MSNPHFIYGISNYCDRWCEKCPLTHRCRAFKASEVGALQETDGKRVLESVAEHFDDTMAMLKNLAEDDGMDWKKMVAEARDIEMPQPVLDKPQQYLLQQTHTYSIQVASWLEKTQNQLEAHFGSLILEANMGIAHSEKSLLTLSDALDTLQWYLFFIERKTERAIYGLYDEITMAEDFIQNDSNGSAKIAMMAIERSINCWEILQKNVPALGDEILDWLVLLNNVRSEMTTIFPHYSQFIRPGFDTLPPSSTEY